MLRRLAIAAFVLLAAACDPCSGIVGCNEAPFFAFRGRVVDPLTNNPAGGVTVEFRPTGGVGLRDTALTAVTGPDGGFTLSVGALEPGVVTGVLTIGRGGTAYTVDDVSRRTVEVRGDARAVGHDLAAYPFIDVGQPLRTRTGDPLRLARVEFRRTGGVEVLPGRYSASADTFGNVAIALQAQGQGEVVGDLYVSQDSGRTQKVIRGIRYSVQTQIGRVWTVAIGTDPWLGYFGVLLRADSTPARGVRTRLVRTGGIATATPEVTAVTNESGAFTMELVPEQQGVLFATLYAQAEGQAEVKVAELEISTFQRYEYQKFGTWVLPTR